MGCTVAELGRRMSALEFAHWLEFEAEEPAPPQQLAMHWQLLAAVHNSGKVAKRDGTLFAPADFSRALWAAEPVQTPAPPKPPGPDELRAQVRALWGNR